MTTNEIYVQNDSSVEAMIDEMCTYGKATIQINSSAEFGCIVHNNWRIHFTGYGLVVPVARGDLTFRIRDCFTLALTLSLSLSLSLSLCLSFSLALFLQGFAISFYSATSSPITSNRLFSSFLRPCVIFKMAKELF
jgi:hypothetical protein